MHFICIGLDEQMEPSCSFFFLSYRFVPNLHIKSFRLFFYGCSVQTWVDKCLHIWLSHSSIHRKIHLDIECMIYVSSFIFLFGIKHHLLVPLFPTNYHHKQPVDCSLRVGLPKQVEHRFVIGHLPNHNTWYYHMKLSLNLFYECTIFGLQIEYFLASFPIWGYSVS